MADNLAQIFGTEKDRVNCPFFFKIGACRHGDKCSRIHHRPTLSQTLLLTHLYTNPFVGLTPEQINQIDEKQVQDQFETFYADIFEELCKYGEIEEINVCDNLGEHMVGNVYVKYTSEDDAGRAMAGIQGRFYGGKPIVAEFSPVTDFREARCRQYYTGECTRGGFCHFMHLKKVPQDLKRELYKLQRTNRRGGDDKERSKSRSRSRSRSRSPRRENRERERDKDKDRDREDEDRHSHRSGSSHRHSSSSHHHSSGSSSRHHGSSSHRHSSGSRHRDDSRGRSHSSRHDDRAAPSAAGAPLEANPDASASMKPVATDFPQHQ